MSGEPGSLTQGSRLIPVMLVIGVAGCAAVGRRNSDCSWPQEGHLAILDLGVVADRRHLANDALVAEDLAIRYADGMSGPRSGHFRGRDSYRAAREGCMNKLFAMVGHDHGVNIDRVRHGVRHRSGLFDALVLLSFATLYFRAASRVASRVVHGSSGSLPSMIIAALFASMMLGIVGFLTGAVWSGVAETIRVGNGHVSYRVNRIPWRQHPGALLKLRRFS